MTMKGKTLMVTGCCVILMSCNFGNNPNKESQLLLLPLTMTESERVGAEQRADLYLAHFREFSNGTHGDAKSVREHEEKFLKATYELTTQEERSKAVATMHQTGLLSDEGKRALDEKLHSEEGFVQALMEEPDELPAESESENVRANQYVVDYACILPVTNLHEMGGKYLPAALGCIIAAFFEFLTDNQTGAALLCHKHKLPGYEVAGTIWIVRF